MFELFYVLIIFLLLFCVLITIWLIFRLDTDLQLFLYQKFGKTAGALKGQVCWVTGASSGIGEALAVVLAQSGVKLVISGTNVQRLEDVKKRCISFGKLTERDVLILCFDVRDCSQHKRLLSEVLSHFGKVDILVSNAGRTQRAAFHQIDIEVDKQLFDLNVFGLISLTRVVLNYYLENQVKGQFIVSSSLAGRIGKGNNLNSARFIEFFHPGSPYSCSYSASKHALHVSEII